MVEQVQNLATTVLVRDVIETCMIKGLMIKSTTKETEHDYIHAPISPFPTPFPNNLYKEAIDLQTPLGVMISDLVHQPDKIWETLKFFKEQDELMTKMIKLSEKFNSLPIKQNIHLCILRSDYMVDKVSGSLKLVEYNTIASSFGCLHQRTREMQKFIRSKYEGDIKYNYEQSKLEDQLGIDYIKDLAQVFRDAIFCYKESLMERLPEHQTEIEQIWVAFIVDKGEKNVCDQKWIETTLFEEHQVKSMRVTFDYIHQHGKVDDNQILTINGKEIGFVYYRTGYQLEQYDGEKDWKAREMLECSMPVKCPSIDVHLCTFKKFQQTFGNEQILKTIMKGHEEESEKIKHLFKGIWTLEGVFRKNDYIQNQVVTRAMENPDQFVLKPQKEGGGHNFYGEEVREKLQNSPHEELDQYLIMERINPPEIDGYMLRNGKLIKAKTVSELGIFSNIFIDTTQIDPLDSKVLGRLLRTKASSSNEGGVNAGFSVIDDVHLIDTDLKDEIKPMVSEL